MNEIKIFESTEFGAVRTIDTNGQPWFVGKDVAEALGYSNSRDALLKHVDSEDKADVAICDGRQSRTMAIINESGLYSLIMSSKLPSAKKFKRWVTSEVLPSLRKNGSYGTPLNFEEIISKTAAAVASEVMKQVIPMINPVVEHTEDVIKRRKRPASIISNLDPAIRKEVEDMLMDDRHSYLDIVHFLNDIGVEISIGSVHRYSKRLRNI